jgi:hypothetical protein
MTEANIAKIVAGLSLIVNGFQSWIQKEFEKDCISIETLESIIRIAQGQL